MTERNDLEEDAPGDPGASGDAGSDTTFDPSAVQATRGRMQGLGVGQKEIDQQRDPTRAASAEQYGSSGGSSSK